MQNKYMSEEIEKTAGEKFDILILPELVGNISPIYIKTFKKMFVIGFISGLEFLSSKTLEIKTDKE